MRRKRVFEFVDQKKKGDKGKYPSKKDGGDMETERKKRKDH